LNDYPALTHQGGAVGVTVDYTDINHGHPFDTNGGNGVAGVSHTNTQPTIALNFILFAGT
jgi:hypothetical protein